jgi:hypothetical protein
MNPRTIINFVAFQAAWFGCVFATAAGRPILGACAPLAATVVHLAISRDRIRTELRTLGAAALLGLFLDGGAVALGLLRLPGEVGTASTLFWFVALWIGFGTTLSSSLSWLSRSTSLACVFGAVAGPLSYYAGVRLGALVAAESWTAWAWVCVEWAVATPLLLRLANPAVQAKGAR